MRADDRAQLRREALDRLRETIDAGFASLDRGEGVIAEEVFVEIEAKLERCGR